MAEAHFLKIVGFGLIGEGQRGDRYRSIVLQDTANNKQTEFLVYKKKRPGLWSDIEAMEKGRNIPPYKGAIIQHRGLEIVVFADEDPEEAYREQKWRLKVSKKISYNEAEAMRMESKGYSTEQTPNGCLEISWNKIDPETERIRFRHYNGNGTFGWSRWFEIRR